MNNENIEDEGIPPIYTKEDALFMRPKSTPVQVTEAIRRADAEVHARIGNDTIKTASAETLKIILEYHLDDVLGHGEEPAFTG